MSDLAANDEDLVSFELSRDSADCSFQIFQSTDWMRCRHQAAVGCMPWLCPPAGREARATILFAARLIRRRKAWSSKLTPSAVTNGDDSRKRFIP